MISLLRGIRKEEYLLNVVKMLQKVLHLRRLLVAAVEGEANFMGGHLIDAIAGQIQQREILKAHHGLDQSVNLLWSL